MNLLQSFGIISSLFNKELASFSIISDQMNTFHYVSHVSLINGECGGVDHFAMSM